MGSRGSPGCRKRNCGFAAPMLRCFPDARRRWQSYVCDDRSNGVGCRWVQGGRWMVRRARTARVVTAAGVFLVAAIALASVIASRLGAPSGLQPCTIGQRPAECERFAVRENPGDPGGRKIKLNVAVFRATGGHAEAGPAVLVRGVGRRRRHRRRSERHLGARARVNVDRDIVFIDQRGTGSSKLSCPLLPRETPNVPAAAVTAAARQCAERIGPTCATTRARSRSTTSTASARRSATTRSTSTAAHTA